MLRLCTLALLLLLASALAGAASVNLLANGSFENGVTGWSAPAGGNVGLDSNAKDGAHAARLTIQQKGYTSLQSQKITVTGNRTYLISLWFHSLGFSSTKDYQGVSASYYVTWLDVNGKELAREGIGLPYGPQKDWAQWHRVVIAPAGTVSAQLCFSLSLEKDGALPSVLWLDDIRLATIDGKVKAGGNKWVFHAASDYYSKQNFRRAADDATDSGFCVIANTRFTTTPGYLLGNIYYRSLPPGQYLAVFRVKVADPSPDSQVVSLDVNTEVQGSISARQVTTSQFKTAGEYRDIALRFIVPPNVGFVDFRVYWPGKVTAAVDCVTVYEEEGSAYDG